MGAACVKTFLAAETAIKRTKKSRNSIKFDSDNWPNNVRFCVDGHISVFEYGRPLLQYKYGGESAGIFFIMRLMDSFRHCPV